MAVPLKAYKARVDGLRFQWTQLTLMNIFKMPLIMNNRGYSMTKEHIKANSLTSWKKSDVIVSASISVLLIRCGFVTIIITALILFGSQMYISYKHKKDV